MWCRLFLKEKDQPQAQEETTGFSGISQSDKARAQRGIEAGIGSRDLMPKFVPSKLRMEAEAAGPARRRPKLQP